VPPVGSHEAESSALTLLLIGGFFLGIGWIVGAVLLWRSNTWTVADKLIGTLLWPGGLVTGLVFAIAYYDRGGPGFVIAVVAVAVPVASFLYLRRKV
jgi:hypothetical protein